MFKILSMLQKNLVWAIPISMTFGLVFGYFFDAGPLKRFIIPVTFIMVYPMMVTLNTKSIFKGEDLTWESAHIIQTEKPATCAPSKAFICVRTVSSAVTPTYTVNFAVPASSGTSTSVGKDWKEKQLLGTSISKEAK